MKVEGYEFPDGVADNELIVDAAVAPVWKEGDECFRCKVWAIQLFTPRYILLYFFCISAFFFA